MKALELDELHHPRLGPLSLQVSEGELLAVCGPSGSGKTTLLRLVAGLEPPAGGRLLVHGQANLPPHLRQLAMVFQSLALWPHLTVAQNLSRGGVPVERIPPLADRLGIEPLLASYPDRLSGGERQRVALARALGTSARMLLLDEPLAQLDTALRADLLELLASERSRRTLLYVTHDAREAMQVADRVLFLQAGRAHQLGPPAELWRRPGSAAVARFFGPTNLIRGRRDGQGMVHTCLGLLPSSGPPGEVQVVVRPSALRPSEAGAPASLIGARDQGPSWEWVVEVQGERLRVLSPNAPPGQQFAMGVVDPEMTWIINCPSEKP